MYVKSEADERLLTSDYTVKILQPCFQYNTCSLPHEHRIMSAHLRIP